MFSLLKLQFVNSCCYLKLKFPYSMYIIHQTAKYSWLFLSDRTAGCKLMMSIICQRHIKGFWPEHHLHTYFHQQQNVELLLHNWQISCFCYIFIYIHVQLVWLSLSFIIEPFFLHCIYLTSAERPTTVLVISTYLSSLHAPPSLTYIIQT